MSDERDNSAPPDRASSNIGPDGSFIVGKGKPPESGKYREGDGRKRGRRAKGTRNLLTDFDEEMAAMVKVAVDGQAKRVTRQRSIVMRTVHDASRGDAKARQAVMQLEQQRRLATSNKPDPAEAKAPLLGLSDLSAEDLEHLNRLLHKAGRIPYVPPDTFDPLRSGRDPTDERNYHTERTVEGLHLRHCSIPTVPDQLISMENRAYVSAALPRQPGCHPGHAGDKS